MSADLKDLRVKLSPRALAFIRARARVKNVHPNEVVRDIVEAWVDMELDVAKIADGFLRAEGYGGILQGSAGHNGAGEGSAGQRTARGRHE